MANFKIINADKLDAAMTATANAIRAKTGSEAEIEWDYENDTGFASAVAAITGDSGGVHRCPRAEPVSIFRYNTLIEATMSWVATAVEAEA